MCTSPGTVFPFAPNPLMNMCLRNELKKKTNEEVNHRNCSTCFSKRKNHGVNASRRNSRVYQERKPVSSPVLIIASGHYKCPSSLGNRLPETP